jgi:hypothetical protein
MTDTLHPLLLDLVESVAAQPRPYCDVLEAWRTSCPRLAVWEEAVDRGYVVRERVDGRSTFVTATPAGRAFLQQGRRTQTFS